MSTLEMQYRDYLNSNPNNEITFEEWKSNILGKMLNTIKSMDDDSDLSDWDTTINDGLTFDITEK
jgi:hypothetical protein